MKRAEQKKSWDGCRSRYTHCRFWVWGWVRPGVDCSGKWGRAYEADEAVAAFGSARGVKDI